MTRTADWWADEPDEAFDAMTIDYHWDGNGERARIVPGKIVPVVPTIVSTDRTGVLPPARSRHRRMG